MRTRSCAGQIRPGNAAVVVVFIRQCVVVGVDLNGPKG